ncbi:MAG: hypothetical protein IPJ52_00830 [Rhodocyclaceae bacterium]|nr:hypothetical protein [Rhodocyclaceae bacterium]
MDTVDGIVKKKPSNHAGWLAKLGEFCVDGIGDQGEGHHAYRYPTEEPQADRQVVQAVDRDGLYVAVTPVRSCFLPLRLSTERPAETLTIGRHGAQGRDLTAHGARALHGCGAVVSPLEGQSPSQEKAAREKRWMSEAKIYSRSSPSAG